MTSAFENRFTVAVLGAAGGIGQPLSLLLSTNPLISHLRLYDVVPIVSGVAADISHINTSTRISGHAGSVSDPATTAAALREALSGVDLVVIPAGLPRKPGMSRDDLFDKNASIVKDLVSAVCEHCPKALVCIISNPVNSTVPIAAEVLRSKGVFNAKRLFGVSTLDVVRANKFVAEAAGFSPEEINVPVVGGHSGVTILPLLSQTSPSVKLQFSNELIEKLTDRIQNAGTEVVEAKQGGGSATLSMAFAGARFAGSALKGLAGERGVVECTYVYDEDKQTYFASPVTLGLHGVEKIHSLANLSEYEQKQLTEKVMPELQKNIKKGVEFATSKL